MASDGWLSSLLFLVTALVFGPVYAQNTGPNIGESPRLECFKFAYPGAFKIIETEANMIRLKLTDGTEIPWDDHVADKTPTLRLASPDLQDTVHQTYPSGWAIMKPKRC